MNKIAQQIAALKAEQAGLIAGVKKWFDEIDAKAADGKWEDIEKSHITEAERTRIGDANKRIEEIGHKLAELVDLDFYRKGADNAERFARMISDEVPGPVIQKGQPVGSQLDLLRDPSFKAWHDEFSKNWQSPVGVKTPRIDLKTLITGASSTSGGAFVVNQRLGIVDPGTVMRPLTVLDLVTRIPVTSDTVEFVKVTSFTNAAAETAEATNTSTGTKPESAAAFAIVSEAVKSIAHWIPITRRALADAAQLNAMVQQLLLYGVRERLALQIVAGDGTGENLTGVLSYSGTTSQAYATDVITTLRKARTKVRTTGRATPNGYLLHPMDWEAIDLLQDNEGRYYFGGPTVVGSPRLWGLPVAEDEGCTQGYGICADWNLALLFDREVETILATDSHSDFFVKNILVLLAEGRYAFGLQRPAAFVIGDLTA